MTLLTVTLAVVSVCAIRLRARHPIRADVRCAAGVWGRRPGHASRQKEKTNA